MSTQRPTLLTIPLEIRLQIYAYLLTLTPLPIYSDNLTSSQPLVHPAILFVNHQINHEATRALYRDNTFIMTQPVDVFWPYSTSETRSVDALKAPLLIEEERDQNHQPPFYLKLRTTMPPIPLHLSQKHNIRRFLLPWRVDKTTQPKHTSPQSDEATAYRKEAVREILSGAESVTLQCLSAGAMGADASALQDLEGVRGVGRFVVREEGMGLDGYLEWLKGRVEGVVGGGEGVVGTS